MDFSACVLKPMDTEAALIISEWEYLYPYDVYSFKGRKNNYLFNKKLWGTEQFYLACNNDVIGQIACQFDNDILWVGWSLAPAFCGKGNGPLFVIKCIEEIRRKNTYNGYLYLRVADWNGRAKKTYEKAGFVYVETILDEIAYSNSLDDFWVMRQG